MTKPTRTILLSAVLALSGCAMQTEDGTSAGLVTVDKADIESQLFYIDPSISSMPMTADEVPDLAIAIPVQIRFYDDLAVAWRVSPSGESLGCANEAAVASWRLETAVPTSGDDIAPEGVDPPVETPAPTIRPPRVIETQPPFAQVSSGVASVRRQGPYDPFARLDWLRGRLGQLVELPRSGHPGCF